MKGSSDYEDSERQKDISRVIDEKDLLTRMCKQLIDILPSELIIDKNELEESKLKEINKLLIEISNQLGKIGDFCDKPTSNKIIKVQRYLTIVIDTPIGYSILRSLLPIISGLQVDFNKRPFRIITFTIKGVTSLKLKK